MYSSTIDISVVVTCIVLSSQDSELIPPRWDVYDNGKIYDITHRITAATPTRISQTGIGEDYLRLHDSMRIIMSIYTRCRRITARVDWLGCGYCWIEYMFTSQENHQMFETTVGLKQCFVEKTVVLNHCLVKTVV
ncbi:hypothetical protein Hanom_Chr04g00352501 [Helianthus anomalus]